VTELAHVTGLPLFDNVAYEAHVEAFKHVHAGIEERLWALGAIVDSLERNYGRQAIPEFAGDVGYSPRRVWELGQTYRAWKERDRAQNLSFRHHTIAARQDDPDWAIEIALTTPTPHGGPLSTREFEEELQQRKEEAYVVEGAEVVTRRECPRCNGEGWID
jgi:hypothetical protein